MAAQIPRAQHRRGTAIIEVEEIMRLPKLTIAMTITISSARPAGVGEGAVCNAAHPGRPCPIAIAA